MGFAYLKDGTRMDYKDYIDHHPHWQAVRQARFDFDNHMCVICHKKLDNCKYEIHHMNYDHLGDERLTDVVTMCTKHHTMFHSIWQKQKFWKGREPNHWDIYNIEHTAKLCIAYENEDLYISKNIDNPNLCNRDIARQYVDKYYAEYMPEGNPVIDPNDFTLYIRNKRYEMFFEAEARGLTVEEFLDECYGQKIRGKNPIRQEAGKKKGTFDHTPKSFHKHYSENKNINRLMDKVNRIKEDK